MCTCANIANLNWGKCWSDIYFLLQDDSDLVFDEDVLADEGTSLWSSLVANSRVKREPPSLEDKGRARHGKSVNGSSRLAAKGLWTGHHKTKKHDLNHEPAIKKKHIKKGELTKKKHTKRNSKVKPIAVKINVDDEDMLADGSGSGAGPFIPLPPIENGGSGTRSKFTFKTCIKFEWNLTIQHLKITEVYRCSLIIQEPYNDELGDRFSDDFTEMSERFNTAIEEIYQIVPGSQTATVQTFEYKFLIA